MPLLRDRPMTTKPALWPLAWPTHPAGWTPSITELAVSIAGPYAAARLPFAEAAAHALALPEDALWAMGTYLNDRAATIYGGTNEVQRNLIAQHLLSAH